MRSPLDKPFRITSEYGNRILGGLLDFHNGIDLVPQDGKHPTNLYSTVDGTVIDVRSTVPDSHTGLGITTLVTGNYANIRTKEGYTLIYRHMKQNSVAVKLNQEIKTGNVIGVMGTTGQSTGVHLHYEIRDTSNQSINPKPYLDTNVPLPFTHTPFMVYYFVQILENLNIRSGAGTNYPIVKTLTDKGTSYAITAETEGQGAKKWGKLENGLGWIALDFTKEVQSATIIKLLSRVRVNLGAKAYNGVSIASFVYNNTYTVDALTGDRAVLDSKGLNTAFNVKDLLIA